VIVAPPPAAILRVTNPGDSFEKIQKELTKRGFAPGRVDGVYGPQTASAVIAFQASWAPMARSAPATRKALGM
jgi:peptidoglycan hydrolase-like protein with peptidoglycan-binding domain